MTSYINWRSLFDRLGIHYVVRSSNISAGEIGVKCPWCGASDPSEHLAIDENGRGYVCRRNRAHRGKSAAKLLSKLKRISYSAAESLIGRRSNTPTHSSGGISKFKQFMQGNAEQSVDLPPLQFWPEFKPLTQERGLSRVGWNYLVEDRGFTSEEIHWLRNFYDLHYASSGRFAYRVIIPIYDYEGWLVNWTGRAVGGQEPRYRALPEQEAAPPGNYLLAIDQLLHYGGVVLIVCEGPLDAFRISTVGHKYGIYGTCLFGLNISPSQAELLRELHEVFEQIYLVLDPAARLRALGMLRRAGLSLPALNIPEGAEDPGAMTSEQTEEWLAPFIEKELYYGEGTVTRRGYA